MMSAPSNEIGTRLRRVRNQQGMSLADVEKLSGGAWKAVVVGAYERGDRAVSISRLASLAEFYGVPLSELLPGATVEEHDGVGRGIVLDLTSLTPRAPEPVAAVARFADQVRRTRGDHNGRVLSLRASDVYALAMAAGVSSEALMAALRDCQVLISHEATG
jgi:transcriptional regulator with XRE-family HTH domain